MKKKHNLKKEKEIDLNLSKPTYQIYKQVLEIKIILLKTN